MNVRSICASISVTITVIWTKFGTEHKYHTINTPEWQNLHKLKIQDGDSRHLKFQRNFNNSELDTNIYTKFYGKMHHGHAEITTWPKVETGSWFARRHQINVWSISVLNSVTMADIWTKFYIELKHHTVNMMECSKFTWFENPRWWRPPSWISENVNNSELVRAICAKSGGQMHHGHAEMTHDQNSKIETGTFLAWRHYYVSK